MMRKKTSLFALLWSLSLMMALIAAPVHSVSAQPEAAGKLGGGIVTFFTKSSLQGALDDGTIKDLGLRHASAIKSFYEERQNEPVWANRDLKSVLNSVIPVIEESWTHGLNPESYHLSALRKMRDDLSPISLSRADPELVITDAVIGYGRDITGMRVDAAKVGERAEYWTQPLAARDILSKVSSAKDPGKALKDLAPKSTLYDILRKELVRLSATKSPYDHLLPLDFGRTLFRPGDHAKAVAALRVRLGVKYDPALGPENYYDDRLASAVMAFQRQHGIRTDGIIGPETLSLLNRTQEDHMRQIVANLERLRWMDRVQPERYVLVNIPSQKLWAVEDGKIIHEIRVVVGMPSRETESFKAEITGVRFNPTWTVPLNLKMKDFLPHLQEDPDYYARNGISYIEGYGSESRILDPRDIDWQNMTWSRMNQIRIVQSAGDHNALGRIRILMPNRYNIYLHDTNHQEFFSRDVRTLSSGCVRLSEPRKVADFVLSHNKGWSEAKIDQLVAGEKTVEIPAISTMPVYIVYQTMWVDAEGRLIYGADVYGRDKKLLDVLAASDGFRLPKPAETAVARAESAENVASAR